MGVQTEKSIKEEIVTADNARELYERAKRELSYEEFSLLQDYVRRVHPDVPEGGLPVGVSIGVMIESQRAFLASGGRQAGTEAGAPVPTQENLQSAAAGPVTEQPSRAPAEKPPVTPRRTAAEKPQAATPPAAEQGPAPAEIRTTSAEPVQEPAQEPAPVREEPVARPAETAPPPAPATVYVPEGTRLVVRLAQSLSSKTAEPGQKFEAILDEDLVVDGQVVAPAGSKVVGTVVEAKASGKVKGKAQLALRLASLHLGEQAYRLATNTLHFEAEGTGKEDAKKVGIGAAIGAVIGAIAGGKKGAAIGSVLGAGAGTGVVLATPGDEVEFEKEQRFQFRLEDPLDLPARRQ
ncbi:MAG: hypothetical protein Kow00109_09710 [Acidobacteriota bacterium]